MILKSLGCQYGMSLDTLHGSDHLLLVLPSCTTLKGILSDISYSLSTRIPSKNVWRQKSSGEQTNAIASITITTKDRKKNDRHVDHP